MKRNRLVAKLAGLVAVAAVALLLVGSTGTAWAHCDTLDGPVIRAAEQALETGNVKLVLVWVEEDHEAEVIDAFNKTMAARGASPEAKAVADQFFFETLVRVHRAGEGAAYDGLKPAGQDFGPAVTGADAALETGELQPLVDLMTETVEHGVREHYDQVMALKDYDPNDVAAGRECVAAYVEHVHYVEGVYNTASGAAHEHGADANTEAAGGHLESVAASGGTGPTAPTTGTSTGVAAGDSSMGSILPWALVAALGAAVVALGARLRTLQRTVSKRTVATR